MTQPRSIGPKLSLQDSCEGVFPDESAGSDMSSWAQLTWG